jgi:hypothetical protein
LGALDGGRAFAWHMQDTGFYSQTTKKANRKAKIKSKHFLSFSFLFLLA